MTNESNNNDKLQQNQASKDQQQPKAGQQTGQQQGQHAQQGKAGEAMPNADVKHTQENKTGANKDESPKK